MPGERHGVASWPGAVAVESCTYTMGHGISPGTAILKIYPQAAPVASSGTLTIGDGAAAIALPDCRLDDIKVETTESGRIWSLQISDRRWKWRDFGSISGAYNQLDEPHKKLIPWTIQSPTELAVLCLDVMGETGYSIDLPPGFTHVQGTIFANQNPPWIGVNPGNTNPPVNWTNEPPAQALQRLCEYFGRRVIYQIATNTILIAKPGLGAPLPNGSIAQESPSISNPPRPSRVAAYGAPTIYQGRLQTQAVGEEWDGSFRPIDQLSYKPAAANGRPQISTATVTTNGSSNTYQIFIGAAVEDSPTTGALIEVTSSSSESTVAGLLAAAINASADPRIATRVTATAASGVVTVTARENGLPFTFWAKMSGTISGTGEASIVPALTQAAEAAAGGWEYSVPPLFSGVRATERLRYEDAIRLAQKWIYKAYQLTGIDAGPRGGRIRVPGYRGLIRRRQQIILLPVQLDQITPQPLDPNVIPDRPDRQDPRVPALIAYLENFYNGYSRAKPAVCYGSMTTLRSGGVANAWWVPGLGLANTLRSGRIYVDFTIDPENQLVVFTNCVYRFEGGRYKPSVPVLQTGFHVRDADSNALLAYVAGKALAGVEDNTNIAVRTYPDIQLEIIGDYDNQHNIIRERLDPENDAVKRAAYYVDGLEAQYLTAAALTRTYLGIMPIQLDGAISQITWEIGGGHLATTTASTNTEHSIWVPPYPARRRAEFLRPANQAAIEQAVNPGNLGRSLHTPARPGEL